MRFRWLVGLGLYISWQSSRAWMLHTGINAASKILIRSNVAIGKQLLRRGQTFRPLWGMKNATATNLGNRYHLPEKGIVQFPSYLDVCQLEACLRVSWISPAEYIDALKATQICSCSKGVNSLDSASLRLSSATWELWGWARRSGMATTKLWISFSRSTPFGHPSPTLSSANETDAIPLERPTERNTGHTRHVLFRLLANLNFLNSADACRRVVNPQKVSRMWRIWYCEECLMRSRQPTDRRYPIVKWSELRTIRPLQ